ncbi:MAG TPA: rhomboid family intramembrane serine protease [bacterium]
MQYYQKEQFRFGFGDSIISPGVKYIIFATGLVFVLQTISGSKLIAWFGLHPIDVYREFRIWQLITYIFLHGDFIHILLNMLILWMFGCEVERNWGTNDFIKYYFICGVGAGVFHILFHLTSEIPVVGASGAIYGILLAFAMLFPDRPIILFPFFIALKAKYWAMIFAAVALVFGLLGGQNGVAHFAHLGGMLVGFIYLKLSWKLPLFGMDFIKRKKGEWEFQKIINKKRKLLELRQTIDVILDKINEVGYENLTEKEKRILESASSTLANENGN